MSDTSTSAPPAAKAKRQTVADRQWIGADGKEVEDETKATGFRYVLLGEGVDKAARVASGVAFRYDFNTTSAGNPETMLAIFGGLTKAGNIVNTAVNGEDPVTDPKEVIAAIKSWFDQLDSGKWGEERSGIGAARYDKEKLAQAISSVTKKPAAGFLAKMETKVADGKREILYGTWALRNPQVRSAYDALVPPTAAPDASAL